MTRQTSILIRIYATPEEAQLIEDTLDTRARTEALLGAIPQEDTMKISVQQARDVDRTNAHTVIVTDAETGIVNEYTVWTNSNGKGLWVDGKQIEGTSQFEAGSRPSESFRRYFTRR